MELNEKLAEMKVELKAYFDKAEKESKDRGTVTEATRTAVEALQKQVDAIDVKMAQQRIDEGPGVDLLEKEMKEDDSIMRLLKDKRGKAVLNLSSKQAKALLEGKTTITSGTGGAVGAATSGVLLIDRIPGIVPEARQGLTVRDLLTARPTTFQVIDFVKVNSPMVPASPQVEAGLKFENQVTFTTVSERVRTIATWIPATRQVLDDFAELYGFIRQTMPYYLNLAEETQLLSGDGTNENLHGLIPQATAFNTALLSNSQGWNKIDIIGRGIQQVTVAKELPPTFVVVHPNDWWDMRLTKDSYGRYILGDPQQGAMAGVGFGTVTPTPNLFGLNVVPTTNIANGTFLIGSGNPIAAEIRDRMDVQIDISTEHSDYWVRNMVAVRAEKRLALLTKRGASFITGSFTRSPA